MHSSLSEWSDESTKQRSGSSRRRRGIALLAGALMALVGLVPAASATSAASGEPAADTSPTALCDSTLRYGDSGDCVEQLQQHLNELDLNCGNELAVDGAFGPSTRMRVYAFQGRNQIAVDGVVGPDTRGKLQNPDEGLAVQCSGDVESVIRDVWPDNLENRAIEVARCESGLNPIAVGGPNTNGTLDYGVFQFNGGGTLQEYLPGSNDAEKIDAALHLEQNVQAALQLYNARGWQPWTCARSFDSYYEQLQQQFDARMGLTS